MGRSGKLLREGVWKGVACVLGSLIGPGDVGFHAVALCSVLLDGSAYVLTELDEMGAQASPEAHDYGGSRGRRASLHPQETSV